MCELCGGRGITASGIKCQCLLKEELLSYLPVSVRGIPYSEFTMTHPDNVNTITHTIISGLKSGYLSKLKTFLSIKYLTTGGTYTYQTHTGTSLVDIYVTDGILPLVDLDFLVLELGNDPSNKALPQILEFIINKRFEGNKITWVYIPNKYIEQIKSTYGREVYTLLFDSKIFLRIS